MLWRTEKNVTDLFVGLFTVHFDQGWEDFHLQNLVSKSPKKRVYRYTIRIQIYDTIWICRYGRFKKSRIHPRLAFIKYVRYMSVCLCNGLMVHKTDDDNILLSVLLFCI